MTLTFNIGMIHKLNRVFIVFYISLCVVFSETETEGG